MINFWDGRPKLCRVFLLEARFLQKLSLKKKVKIWIFEQKFGNGVEGSRVLCGLQRYNLPQARLPNNMSNSSQICPIIIKKKHEHCIFEPKIDSVGMHRFSLFIYRWIALVEICHLSIRHNVRFWLFLQRKF